MKLRPWTLMLIFSIFFGLSTTNTYIPLPVSEESACCPGKNILMNTGCLQYELARLQGPNATEKKVDLHCIYGMYMLEPIVESMKFTLNYDETLIIDDFHQVQKGKYCLTDKVEIRDDVNITTLDQDNLSKTQVAMVCFPPQEQETFLSATVTGTLAFISVGFLILTLVVYGIVPELRDLQGKCMICTSICLCLGFFHLALAQLFIIKNDNFCLVNGFLVYFWLIGAFFWMNVVSINMMKCAVFRNCTISERKTFIAYNIYGWGCPLLFLLCAVVSENVNGDHLKPGFGRKSCWFSGKVETWAFFYGPMATLIICNIILFIITSMKLWNQKSYENVSKLRSMKYKFLLYLKIFLVMGLSWIFEIISFVHDTRHIVWLIIDTFNSLQGLVFFLVLVLLRKRALRGLANKGLRLPCAPNAHTGPDEECDEIVHEEETPTLTTLS